MDVSITHQQVLNLVYELAEDGTYVSKHGGVVKDHTFKCICKWCIKLVSQKDVKKMCNGLNSLKMGSTDAHENEFWVPVQGSLVNWTLHSFQQVFRLYAVQFSFIVYLLKSAL
jgi:hypothetical protein